MISGSDVVRATAAPDPLAAGPFHGLRVWVTGASRGLGRAIADDLRRAGARVAVTARSEQDLLAMVEDAAGEGSGVMLSAAGSVRIEDDVRRIEDALRATWGGLDAVVTCAGVSPSFDLAHDLEPAVWREVIDLNLTGTFLVAQAAARLMSSGGSIVTVSSVHAMTGGRRLAAYSASKGGVESLTRALALDWAGLGIRVNCLAPGYFETDMTADLTGTAHQRARLVGRIPNGSLGVPAQLLEAARLLVGSGSSYMTGSVLTVDGGWSIA